ncbi:unnamed protein product [marine sediment metagenome]|uniref:Uncharacterized protein n=1 Tax=marine sediment metagenome TaxID=412755 RepID=X1DBI6_9ZZZZ
MTTKQQRLSWLNDEELNEPEFDIFTPSNSGRPIEFKVLNWERISKTFKLKNKDGEYTGKERISTFIETDKGFLRIDSIRLRKELALFPLFKGKLILQRWVDDSNTMNTYYKIQKSSSTIEISTKRK